MEEVLHNLRRDGSSASIRWLGIKKCKDVSPRLLIYNTTNVAQAPTILGQKDADS